MKLKTNTSTDVMQLCFCFAFYHPNIKNHNKCKIKKYIYIYYAQFQCHFKLVSFHTHTVWYLSHPERQTSFFELFWERRVILNILPESIWHVVTYFYSELSAKMYTGRHVKFFIIMLWWCSGGGEGERGGGGEDYFTHIRHSAKSSTSERLQLCRSTQIYYSTIILTT